MNPSGDLSHIVMDFSIVKDSKADTLVKKEAMCEEGNDCVAVGGAHQPVLSPVNKCGKSEANTYERSANDAGNEATSQSKPSGSNSEHSDACVKVESESIGVFSEPLDHCVKIYVINQSKTNRNFSEQSSKRIKLEEVSKSEQFEGSVKSDDLESQQQSCDKQRAMERTNRCESADDHAQTFFTLQEPKDTNVRKPSLQLESNASNEQKLEIGNKKQQSSVEPEAFEDTKEIAAKHQLQDEDCKATDTNQVVLKHEPVGNGQHKAARTVHGEEQTGIKPEILDDKNHKHIKDEPEMQRGNICNKVSSTQLVDADADADENEQLVEIISENDISNTASTQEPADVKRVDLTPGAAAQETTNNGNDESFVCVVCGRVFSSKRSLQSHSYHHKKKLYECILCGKRFRERHESMRHIRAHRGEKQPNAHYKYSCTVCYKDFRCDVDLARHMHKHTNTTGQQQKQQHVCSVCGLTRSSRRGLQLHAQNRHGSFVL